MRRIIVFLALMLLAGLWIVTGAALEEDRPPCADPMIAFYTAASELCIGAPDGYACNGGASPSAQPEGPLSNSLAASGALVPVNQIDAVNTPPFSADGTTGGLLWMRVPEADLNMLLLGDVTVQNRIAPDDPTFPRWKAFTVSTGGELSACEAHPRNSLIVQSASRDRPVRVVINGASVDLSGTALIVTREAQTVFVVLEGVMRVLSLREAQTLVAGQETRVDYQAGGDLSSPVSPPSVVVPYTAGLTFGLPIELFDRPTIIPQPGFVATDGNVNLRAGPGTNFSQIYQVPGGQNMTILGRNPTGDWYHVRLGNGQTGWMFAELLRRNHGPIDLVYESTPIPPQRFGDAGRVAYANIGTLTLRSAPHAGFPAVHNVSDGTALQLVARSPYSPWVKVEGAGVAGWVPLLNLDTRAIIDSLPIDFTAPLPPEPTAIPGLTGFAFPDPACFPDC